MKDFIKKNKKTVITSSIVAVVVIGLLVLVVKFNQALKEKRRKKQETAIVEPTITDYQERLGHKSLQDNSIMGIFEGDSLLDSTANDTINTELIALSKQLDSTKVEKKEKVVKPKTTSKPAVNNAFSKTIAEDEAKKNKPKKVYVRKAPPKPKTHRDEVSFHFVVLNEDKPQQKQKVEVEEKEDEINLNELAAGRIYGNVTLKHNEPVKLRSTEKVMLSKKKYLPEGALLFGVCTFAQNRFKIHITRAMTPKGNFPCDLVVYDSYDFQEGLFIKNASIDVQPEEASADVIEEVGNVIPNTMVSSTVKGVNKLVQKDVKKMKKVTLKVPDNYSIYLLPNRKS